MNVVVKTSSFVSFSTSVSPEKTWYEYQDPWKSVLVDDRSEQLDKISSTSSSKLDFDRAWFSQEWKSGIRKYERSGRPDKTSWRMMRTVRLRHEDILLDGTAQSVRNEETLHVRSGRYDINPQEEVKPQQFVIGTR